jgi:hypothetical protein
MNLKNVSLLNFEEIKIEAKKKNWLRQTRNIKGICNSCRHGWKAQMKRRRVWN